MRSVRSTSRHHRRQLSRNGGRLPVLAVQRAVLILAASSRSTSFSACSTRVTSIPSRFFLRCHLQVLARFWRSAVDAQRAECDGTDRHYPADWYREKKCDHDDRLRSGSRAQQGKDPAESIYEACIRRFRPIMMTTMAALLGGLPLALGTGTGSELRRPLGITIVGGLIMSQALTLSPLLSSTSILIGCGSGSEASVTRWNRSNCLRGRVAPTDFLPASFFLFSMSSLRHLPVFLVIPASSSLFPCHPCVIFPFSLSSLRHLPFFHVILSAAGRFARESACGVEGSLRPRHVRLMGFLPAAS